MELLVAAAFGIPRPILPYFESSKESDLVMLKMALLIRPGDSNARFFPFLLVRFNLLKVLP